MGSFQTSSLNKCCMILKPELDGLEHDSITQDQQELDRISRETVNAEKFLALVKTIYGFFRTHPRNDK